MSIDTGLWEDVVSAARRQRKRPETVVRHALQEYLQWAADVDLLKRTERAAARAGYRARDAEELVRQHRQLQSGPRGE